MTAWTPVAQAWAAALSHHGGQDIVALWDAFCAAAEYYFFSQQVDHLDRPAKRYLGRDSCAVPRLAPVIAPQWRGAECGALTHRHLRLLKLLRRLEAHHKARLALQPMLGPLRHLELNRWALIHQTAVALLTPDIAGRSPSGPPRPSTGPSAHCSGRPPHVGLRAVRAHAPSSERELDLLGAGDVGFQPPRQPLRVHPRQHIRTGHGPATPRRLSHG